MESHLTEGSYYQATTRITVIKPRCTGVRMMINPGRNSLETQQSHLKLHHTPYASTRPSRLGVTTSDV